MTDCNKKPYFIKQLRYMYIFRQCSVVNRGTCINVVKREIAGSIVKTFARNNF